jgi:hypothetical protein
MHVYSGRPDPEWIIDSNLAPEISRLAGGKMGIHPSALGQLGYRGFTVFDTTRVNEPAPMFTAQLPDGAQGPSTSIAGIPELEAMLLWTGRDHVPDDLAVHVQNRLQQRVILRADELGHNCPACTAKDAPPYNPGLWNQPGRRAHNNCYNYANNQVTNSFAQPGLASSTPFSVIDCASVRNSAQSDGLTACPTYSAYLAPGAGWYVALVVWPSQDYHWYRQDDVGCWSHKLGRNTARNIDDAGNAIRDPQTCDRGPYSVFCTFMVTSSAVRIR